MTFRNMAEYDFSYTGVSTIASTTIVTPLAGALVIIAFSSASMAPSGDYSKTLSIGGVSNSYTGIQAQQSIWLEDAKIFNKTRAWTSFISDGSPVTIALSGSGASLSMVGKVQVLDPYP